MLILDKIPKEINLIVVKYLYVHTFTTVVFIIILKSWKQTKCPKKGNIEINCHISIEWNIHPLKGMCTTMFNNMGNDYGIMLDKIEHKTSYI